MVYVEHAPSAEDNKANENGILELLACMEDH